MSGRLARGGRGPWAGRALAVAILATPPAVALAGVAMVWVARPAPPAVALGPLLI